MCIRDRNNTSSFNSANFGANSPNSFLPAVCFTAINFNLLKIKSESTAEIPCAIRVARAAPNTPSLRPPDVYKRQEV